MYIGTVAGALVDASCIRSIYRDRF